MKVCGNGITSNMKDYVVFNDSHDLYYTWGNTKDMPLHLQIAKWRRLLEENPESDALFFPHPIEEAWKYNCEEAWRTANVREINLRHKNNREIILHCFLWNYKGIEEALNLIKYHGFTAIQVTPCQGVKGSWDNVEFWKYYQILGLRFYDNPMGTKEEYINMIKKANKLGIKVIQDIVLRHVAGDDSGALIPHKDVSNDMLPFIKKNVPECQNYDNREDYTTLCTGMPILDWNDSEYQKKCIEFIKELKSYGVNGLRIDQLKHYKVHSEGCDFLRNVFNQFENDMFIYGEVIDCPKEINDLYAGLNY